MPCVGRANIHRCSSGRSCGGQPAFYAPYHSAIIRARQPSSVLDYGGRHTQARLPLPPPRGERARTGTGPAQLTTPHAVRSRRGDGSAALPAGAALPDVARSLQEVTAEANAHASAGPAWPGVQPPRHRRIRRAQEQTHRSIFAPPTGVPVAQRFHQSPRRSRIAGSQRARPGGTAPQGRRAASLGARRNDCPGGLRAARLPWSTWIASGRCAPATRPRRRHSGPA